MVLALQEKFTEQLKQLKVLAMSATLLVVTTLMQSGGTVPPFFKVQALTSFRYLVTFSLHPSSELTVSLQQGMGTFQPLCARPVVTCTVGHVID